MIRPALAALLADPPGNSLGDLHPRQAALVHACDNNLVLLLREGALHEAGPQDLLPPMETLHIRATMAREVLLRYSLPIMSPNSFDR